MTLDIANDDIFIALSRLGLQPATEVHNSELNHIRTMTNYWLAGNLSPQPAPQITIQPAARPAPHIGHLLARRPPRPAVTWPAVSPHRKCCLPHHSPQPAPQ